MKDESEKSIRLLTRLISGICHQPDRCAIVVNRAGALPLVSATPAPADYALLTGRAGRVCGALISLADRLGIRYELSDAHKDGDREQQPFEQRAEFDIEQCMEFVGQFVALLLGEATHMEYERQNDLLYIYIAAQGAEQRAILRELDEVFYPWAYGRGMILKLRRPDQRPAHAR